MDKELRKHLYIEFRYGNIPNGDKMLFESSWKNKLWEEHGIINNMDIYVDTFVNAINEKVIKKWNGKNEEEFYITLTEKDFNFETFFDEIDIPIYITLIPNVGGCKYGGGYLSAKSGWVSKGIYKVQMGNFTFKGEPLAILNRCRITLAHEITHAYDDYGRRRLNSKSDDIFTASIKQGQYKATDISNMEESIESEIGEFLYYTNNIEINAYIAGIKEELIDLMRGTNNSQDAFDAIKKTNIYFEYLKLKRIIDSINELNRETSPLFDNLKNKVLKTYNKTRKREGDLKTIQLKSFNELTKIFNKRFYRFETRFKKQVPKIAFDIYKKVGDRGTDSGIIQN